MVAGLVLLMAGGPPVAERLGLSTFHFVSRQVLYLAPAVALMVAVSFLSLRHVRRLALLTYAIGMALVVARAAVGARDQGRASLDLDRRHRPAALRVREARLRGARRLGLRRGRAAQRDMPGAFLALLLLPATIVPLILQPDFGQTMLITVVWCGLFFVAGLHWFWVLGLGGAGAVGIVAAYRFLPHVRDRIERFLHKGTGDGGGKDGAKSVIDNFQIETAMEALRRGRLVRRAGRARASPSAACPTPIPTSSSPSPARSSASSSASRCVALFAFIVLRGLFLAQRNEDTFCRLAATGLVMMFGLQAAINMAVNVHLMPAKGMTLPFVSYGGSSLISLALGMGFLDRADAAAAARRDGASRLGRARHERPAAASFSAPAAPADISSRPRRSRGALKRLGVRVALATDDRVGALAGSFPAEEVDRDRLRDAVRPLAAADGEGRRSCSASASCRRAARAAPAAGRRRSSASAATRPCRRCSPRRCCASRPSSTSRTASWAAPTASSPARVSAIATGFPEVKGIPAGAPARVVHTGNPVRPAVIEAARTPYPAALHGGKLRLLVFGGSQGARVMSDIVPAAIERLPTELRARLVLVQQAREEDRAEGRDRLCPLASARPRCSPSSRTCRSAWRRRISSISRSGASTVAELAVIGRPVDPGAAARRARPGPGRERRSLAEIGAATVIPQARVHARAPRRRDHGPASTIRSGWTQAAAAAKSAGLADAAERLAALVLHRGRPASGGADGEA